jgi:hypothetical protein
MTTSMKYSESHILKANIWTGLGPSSGTAQQHGVAVPDEGPSPVRKFALGIDLPQKEHLAISKYLF